MPLKSPRVLWNRLVRAARNDPQKAGILTVLVTVLVVLQVRAQMMRGEGPAVATAATAALPDDKKTAAGGGAGGAQSAKDAATALREWMDAPPVPLERNLFAVDLERFPTHGHRPVAVVRGGQGFWDELAKSMSFRADVIKERQILIENLQQRASQLRLQSTLMGPSPKAVIDGDLVGEGDVVASFRVLKIEPRRIIVEREGIKLEILMK